MQVGSAEIIAAAGQTVPSGLAIFGYRPNGVLVSEAGVPATVPMSRGRIYANVSGSVNTGVAIANENNSSATVSFSFTDVNGTDFGSGSVIIPPHGQVAKFLNEAPFNAPNPTEGTFTFSSNVPVSAIALRGLTNQRSEFLLTTLPVSDPDTDANTVNPVFFPHFAYGGGWTTQFILMNPSDTNLTGTLSFFAQGTAGAAAPALSVNIDGVLVTQMTYSIPPRSSKRYSAVSVSSQTIIGSAQVSPAPFTSAPVGVAIFSFNNGGITVSEAGVPSMSAARIFRMYAEADQNGAIQTGVAIRNADSAETTVKFELTRLDGTSTGLSGSLVVPPDGQRSLFLNQIPGFESLPMPFKGVLRISSGNTTVAVLGMRGRWNERGDFIVTTTPATNESSSAPPVLVFPHIVTGGGYTTQFVTFSGTPAEPGSGNLELFSQSGGTLSVNLQ